ncbi:hypothetical protein [Janthinobacterium sp. J1-1]|uniref:hypothetical protein n=1 Tax=Janthinobacterium sp. J1-1 TaxID=3065910 RepID=UPI002812478E|nr:hypothetical protein [Janthinobacterium sp. J1-1]
MAAYRTTMHETRQDAKLIPSFSPLLHGLYQAYPCMIPMLVHMFIHTAKMALSIAGDLSPFCPPPVHKLVHNTDADKKCRQPVKAGGIICRQA